ncbi:hypothetical protein M9H77_28204 [Catharanthus roseus]|uniref:Uncharacterized protein n=1 Tax=Catharanthus roseus TaxID=4058 RepID=A0ACC0AFA3_CATRO|nr:hypothetical protein M9H77_28204 [Catharanthus roseus]
MRLSRYDKCFYTSYTRYNRKKEKNTSKTNNNKNYTNTRAGTQDPIGAGFEVANEIEDVDVKHYEPGSATISIMNLKEKIAQCPTSRRKSGTVAKEVKSHPTSASIFIYLALLCLRKDHTVYSFNIVNVKELLPALMPSNSKTVLITPQS